MSVGKLFVISGPSGVGKGTLFKEAMKIRGDLELSVSVTTRQPRPNEVNGVDYDFIDRAAYDEILKNDGFVEYDIHYDIGYGTPKAQLEEKMTRSNVILDIDPNGAMKVKEVYPDATLIFVMPPSMEELEKRLRTRGDTKDVEKRMKRAIWEIEQAPKYDYIVTNDVVDTCVAEILKIMADKAD